VTTVEIEHARPEVAILRLNRPSSLNAMSWELVEDAAIQLERRTPRWSEAS
jgi:enoyl-CoA hydratase/carnithine racemase